MAHEFITLSTAVGSGSKVATDRITEGANDLEYQIVQLAIGADGASKTIVSGANGLPVTDAGGSLTVDGTVAATQSGIWNIGTVTTVSAVTGITNVVQVADNGSTLSIDDGAGSITVDGTVTIQDGGSTISVDDGGSSITVDGTVSVSGTVTVDSELPAAAALADNTANPTTTSVGTFPHVYDGATWDRWTGAVTQSGTWNVGTVTTVTTVSTVTTLGTITNVVHVDDNGSTLSVDDGGSSLTVDGTVAVSSIAAGDNNIGNVDVVTLPSISAGTNRIGGTYEATGSIIDETGAVLTVKRVAIAAATSGENTLVAAVSGKKIRVLSLALISAGTVSLYFNNATDGAVFGGSTNKIALVANTGFVIPHNPHGWFQTGTDNEALRVNLSGAVAVSGGLTYVEVD